MKLHSTMTDQAALEELGKRLGQRRIALRLNQAELAERAGVAKRTVERIEAGESSQLTSWLRVLRVLELLPALDALIPEESPRPMALLRQSERMPKRVRKGKESDQRAASDGDSWQWGDDQ